MYKSGHQVSKCTDDVNTRVMATIVAIRVIIKLDIAKCT